MPTSPSSNRLPPDVEATLATLPDDEAARLRALWDAGPITPPDADALPTGDDAWAQLDALASEDPDLWSRLGRAQRAHAGLRIAVEDAIAKGAKLLYGNDRQGAVYSPTVLDHVPADCELVVEETFGPPIPIIRIKDLKEPHGEGIRGKRMGLRCLQRSSYADLLVHDTGSRKFAVFRSDPDT